MICFLQMSFPPLPPAGYYSASVPQFSMGRTYLFIDLNKTSITSINFIELSTNLPTVVPTTVLSSQPTVYSQQYLTQHPTTPASIPTEQTLISFD